VEVLRVIESLIFTLPQVSNFRCCFLKHVYTLHPISHPISNYIKLSSFLTIYLTLYTFSFEINESRLSDTRCMIQDVVTSHCGDKRMARRCTRRSLPNYFDMASYQWNVRQNTVTWRWWMNGKNNVTSYTKCSLPGIRVLYTF
jgi:hypothetical protein